MVDVVRFAVLGPLTVDVAASGDPRPVPGGLPRAILASLLTAPNTTVSTDRLIDEVWPDGAPKSAVESLRNHVLRLRRRLGPLAAQRLRTEDRGYRLVLGPGELDELEFTSWCVQGREALLAKDWNGASKLLADALALWRGRPFADVPLGPGGSAHIQRLTETRLLALAGRFQVELHLGRHLEVVAELSSVAEEHPLREEFHRQLMLALYRSDRQAEAQAVYHRLRRTLRDELAVEPSASVRELQRRILSADPGLVAADTENSVQEASLRRRVDRPAQLPADTRAFTGRAGDLARLLALARDAESGTGVGTVGISAINGMGGVGKTALAVHAAHRIRDRFPDGQLFLDLRGHGSGRDHPLTPDEALAALLGSLGVPQDAIAPDTEARSALYRSLLDGTRTLIILDNAGSTGQVRPLLPGCPGCLVLITSRKRLTGMDDAHSMALDVLPRGDALALLHQVGGPDRVQQGDPDLGELAELCGDLPLALRIAASRLRHRRTLSVRDMVVRLRDERSRLEHLSDDERSLAAVFDSSFATLPEAEQRLFRLLGLIPGPDFDAYAAAALLDSGVGTAEMLLESLLDHNLLLEHSPGRYRLHDLIRVYAASLSSAAEFAEDRDAALDRLLAYYRYTAGIADRHLPLFTRAESSSNAAAPTSVPDLPDRDAAVDWMRRERANLFAAFDIAVTRAAPQHAIALATALAAFLEQEGPWEKAVAVHRTAASMAQAAGDRGAEAVALRDLGGVRHTIGDVASAAQLYERALAIHQETGDRLGEANVLHDLGRARYMIGDRQAAVDLGRRALALHRELGERLGQANALILLGRERNLADDLAASADLVEQALRSYQALGHRQGEAEAVLLLSHVRLMAGDLSTGTDLARRALAIFRELGQRQGEANVLWALGRCRTNAGDFAEASDLIRQALAIYREFGRRQGEAVSLAYLAYIKMLAGDLAAATVLYERALPIYREIGQRGGEATSLHQLGEVRRRAGDYPAAIDLVRRALASFEELGPRRLVAACLRDLGTMSTSTGDYPAASRALRRSLGVYLEIGDDVGEAEVLGLLAQLEETAEHARGLPGISR